MQSIDHLTDSLSMKISSNKNKEGPWWFIKIGLKYADSQIPMRVLLSTATLTTSVERQKDLTDW